MHRFAAHADQDPDVRHEDASCPAPVGEVRAQHPPVEQSVELNQGDPDRNADLGGLSRLRARDTQTILLRAAGSADLPDKPAMKTVYENLKRP